MVSRLHIVVNEAEKIQFQHRARREGKTLSAWIRDTIREKAAETADSRLSTLEELETFFANCESTKAGREPDWEEHLKVIEGSIQSGRAGS